MDSPTIKANEILWVENDLYHIESLLWWIKKDNRFNLETASSLFEATEILDATATNQFDLIILDLIMSSQDDQGRVPVWFVQEERLGANGIFLLKYLRDQLSLKCPVLILSIMENPIEHYDLKSYEPIHYLDKRGLKPTSVFSVVKDILVD